MNAERSAGSLVERRRFLRLGCGGQVWEDFLTKNLYLKLGPPPLDPPGADSDWVILEEAFVLRLLQAASSLRGRR